MNKIISLFLGSFILFSLCLPVLATETSQTVEEVLQQLQQQIEQLKAQIAALTSQLTSLKQAKQEIKETVSEIKTTLQLTRQLQEGMTGDDVRLLQEILATDPDIYPEGLKTGYFGPLTKNAVKRFQKIAGLDQVGQVGPQTLAKINELLTEGAGQSGKVPPGLLIAPGIRKKVGLDILNPLPGQILPPGIAKKITEATTEDITVPVISDVTVVDITPTSAKITWTTNKETDSKVWYGTATPLVVDDTTASVSSADLVLEHEIILSSLSQLTAYYFIVSSTDNSDNNNISEELTFTTPETELSAEEQACLDAGASVKIVSCCLTTNDFPNLCLVGACGCSAENSHNVKTCDCGADKCFNGTTCVS